MTASMGATTHTVRQGGTEDLPRVEPLWRAMRDHHARIVGDAWAARSPEESWRRRRASYARWLASREGRLLLAVHPADAGGLARDARVAGYAFVRIRPAGETLDLGERVGELESLSVSADARGQGIGGLLLEAARTLLREEGVAHWFVTFVEANAGAERLYERAGFRPFNRQLLGRVDR